MPNLSKQQLVEKIKEYVPDFYQSHIQIIIKTQIKEII